MAWTKFTDTVVSSWNSTQNWLSKRLADLWGQFDDSIDVEATKRILDEDYHREQRQREQATRQQLRQIETTRQTRHAEIDQQEQSTLTELERDKNARHRARRRQYDADVQAAEGAVRQARQEWQDALDEAAAKRAAIAEEEGPSPLDRIKDLEALDFEELGRRAVSVRGTFNAMATQGLAGGDPIQRVAVAAENTARHTKRLLQEAQHGGLVFS